MMAVVAVVVLNRKVRLFEKATLESGTGYCCWKRVATLVDNDSDIIKNENGEEVKRSRGDYTMK